MNFWSVETHAMTVVPVVHGYIGNFPVTDTVVTSFFNLGIFLLLCLWAQTFSVKKPGRLQVAVESIYTMLTDFIAQIAGTEKIAKKIMPLILTLVLFILISNLTLLIFPFAAPILYEHEPLLRGSTNDINMTLALAVGMVGLVQIFSIIQHNPLGYILHFVKIDVVIHGFKKGIGAGFISLVEFLIGGLEIISEFTRVVSLSLRLFGNIFAGELLVSIFMGMIAILVPIPIMGLAILAGVIQSIVFGALVTSYLSGVLREE